MLNYLLQEVVLQKVVEVMKTLPPSLTYATGIAFEEIQRFSTTFIRGATSINEHNNSAMRELMYKIV